MWPCDPASKTSRPCARAGLGSSLLPSSRVYSRQLSQWGGLCRRRRNSKLTFGSVQIAHFAAASRLTLTEWGRLCTPTQGNTNSRDESPRRSALKRDKKNTPIIYLPCLWLPFSCLFSPQCTWSCRFRWWQGSLCRNRSWEGGGGSAPTNLSSSCSQCTPRRGAEAEPPPAPPLPWPALPSGLSVTLAASDGRACQVCSGIPSVPTNM